MKKLSVPFFAASLLCFAVQPAGTVYTQLLRGRTSSAELQKIELRIMPILEVSEIQLAQLISVLGASDEGYSSPDIVLKSSEVGRRKVTLKVRGRSYAAILDAVAQQTKAVWWVDDAIYLDEQK